MKLRKLSLQGYKTFATKTEFVFDSGITAIVGPNGSGKSNIADALRWVLGEQSYSTLRARRSADMIFAGSAQRARAGMAQAVITLDNSDGWLPIDFSEVEIARRSFRSGENEYLINGQHVRLKDVADLLATSGLAERTYTIIGQGLVDQALSLRSDERRALFEEAAGITHYKTRRAETLRRLEETQRNLQRVNDILEELRPRVAALKRQANRTRNYEQVSTDLRELLRIWYGYKWEQAKRELRSSRQAAGVAEATWEDARRRLLDRQSRLDEIQQRIVAAQQQIDSRQTAREELRQAVEKVRRDQAVSGERRASLERQIADANREEELLVRQLAVAQTELEAALAEMATAQTETQTQQTRMDQFQAAYQGQQTNITRIQDEIKRLENERRRTQTSLAQSEGQLIQLRERLDELAASDAGAASEEQEIAALEEKRHHLENTTSTERQRLAGWQAERAEAGRARQAGIARLKELRRAAQEDEQSISRLRSEVARQEERVASLERTYRRDLQLEPDRLVGQLARIIQLPPDHETALTAALGDRLGAWVVQDESALWQAVELCRQQPGESDTRLLLTALAATAGHSPGDPIPSNRPVIPNERGIIGWANDLMPRENIQATLIDVLLGTVLLVDDEALAYRLARNWPPGYQAVTSDGLVVHGGGLVEVHPAGSGRSLVAREARWREESLRLDEKKQTLLEREKAAADRRQTIDALQEQVDHHTGEERRLERLEVEANQQLSAIRLQIERTRQQSDFLARRRAERGATTAQIEDRLNQTEATLRQESGRLAEVEEILATARDQLAALPVGEVQQQQYALRQALTAAQTILAGRQAVVDSRRATLNQIDGQLHRLRQRLALMQEQYAPLQAHDDDSPTRLEQQLAGLEEELKPLIAGMEADRASQADTQQQVAALQKHGLELETYFTQTRIRLTQLENQVEGLQERIRGDLGLVSLSFDAEQTGATPLPMHEVVEQLPVVTELPPDIEENIQLYRGQLHRIGPINPDAPAELAATEERFEFLSRQVDDLAQTDQQLRKVIAELDELTSKAFAKTVDEVNDVFDHTFKQLFGGGSGRLAMTDPDDPTSSGVEIIARLPNRREQGLALLSGGERSLTAAALIFSLLKVAPPPFCVLDEVDAALDEANVNRFRDLLAELSRKIQFILITHNRGTVQAAQTLYGVSMQPDSSSQVISIRPEEYLKR
jgi:chromosome segregation protein